jgi:hypothetical protein
MVFDAAEIPGHPLLGGVPCFFPCQQRIHIGDYSRDRNRNRIAKGAEWTTLVQSRVGYRPEAIVPDVRNLSVGLEPRERSLAAPALI